MSIIVQFLVALVGLGVSIDYSLLMLFRFREELHHGRDVESALVETMTHAGRSVVVSGSTVAIGLLSMVLLPLPFIRSIGIGGMLIPLVAVLSTLTLTPVLLYWIGHRIDSLRVIPKRIVSADPGEKGFWHRWAGYVVRRPGRIALAGLALVVLLLIPAREAQPRPRRRRRTCRATATHSVGRDALAASGISAGALKPLHDPRRAGSTTRPRCGRSSDSRADERRRRRVRAPARPGGRATSALIEAFPATTARPSRCGR